MNNYTSTSSFLGYIDYTSTSAYPQFPLIKRMHPESLIIDITTEQPNALTRLAIDEARNHQNLPAYDSIEEMLEESEE